MRNRALWGTLALCAMVGAIYSLDHGVSESVVSPTLSFTFLALGGLLLLFVIVFVARMVPSMLATEGREVTLQTSWPNMIWSLVGSIALIALILWWVKRW